MQRPCSTLPETKRILQVPQPPPRHPKTTFAPDRKIALNTVSSRRHTTVFPIGLKVIVYDPTSRAQPPLLLWSAVTTYV